MEEKESQTPREEGPKPTRSRFGWRLLLLLCLFVGYGAIEARHVRFKEKKLVFNDLPAAANRLRIAFITDVHFDRFSSSSQLKRIVNRINAAKPDLILLGGDYADTDPRHLTACMEALSELRAALGCYAVLGNHDYWGYVERVRTGLREAGIALLDNDGVWLGEGKSRWRLAGVSDFWHGRPALEEALGGATEDGFVLLLAHNPDYSETLPYGAADLVLSGHTHGGQATLLGLWSPLMRLPSDFGDKYRSGLVDNGRTTVLVSNGVGTLALPLRYCAPPSVEIITLRSAPR